MLQLLGEPCSFAAQARHKRAQLEIDQRMRGGFGIAEISLELIELLARARCRAFLLLDLLEQREVLVLQPASAPS